MRTKHPYISVIHGEEMLLGEIISRLIERRTYAKGQAARRLSVPMMVISADLMLALII